MKAHTSYITTKVLYKLPLWPSYVIYKKQIKFVYYNLQNCPLKQFKIVCIWSVLVVYTNMKYCIAHEIEGSCMCLNT